MAMLLPSSPCTCKSLQSKDISQPPIDQHILEVGQSAETLSAALCRSFAAKGFGARTGHGYSHRAHGQADGTVQGLCGLCWNIRYSCIKSKISKKGILFFEKKGYLPTICCCPSRQSLLKHGDSTTAIVSDH